MVTRLDSSNELIRAEVAAIPPTPVHLVAIVKITSIVGTEADKNWATSMVGLRKMLIEALEPRMRRTLAETLGKYKQVPW